MARTKKEKDLEIKEKITAESTVLRNEDEVSQKSDLSIEEDRQKRVTNCMAIVQKAMQEYKCDFDISIVLKAGQVIPRIAIVPIEVLQQQQKQ